MIAEVTKEVECSNNVIHETECKATEDYDFFHFKKKKIIRNKRIIN